MCTTAFSPSLYLACVRGVLGAAHLRGVGGAARVWPPRELRRGRHRGAGPAPAPPKGGRLGKAPRLAHVLVVVVCVFRVCDLPVCLQNDYQKHGGAWYGCCDKCMCFRSLIGVPGFSVLRRCCWRASRRRTTTHSRSRKTQAAPTARGPPRRARARTGADQRGSPPPQEAGPPLLR